MTHRGPQTIISFPLKPGARIKLYRVLETRQDLIPSQERQVEIVPGARNSALSREVWGLSLTYGHSCDAALEVQGDT